MSTLPESEGSPEILVKAPFDERRADLILRTSDGAYFRVFKIVLSLASPIFADMFNIPQPPSEQGHDELQVVTISEDSQVLDLCLRHLYPVPPPTALTLQDVRILAEFARKYEVTSLGSVIGYYLTDYIEDDPVGTYAIAITYGYKRVGAMAAQSSLKLPFSHLQSPHLQCITAEQYGELIRYHVACGDAASAVASERKWFLASRQWGRLIWTVTCNMGVSSNLACQSCAAPNFIDMLAVGAVCMSSLFRLPLGHAPTLTRSTRFGPRCLWNYLRRSASILTHHPAAEAVTTDFLQGFIGCPNCPSATREEMHIFSRIFATEIKKAVERVCITLSCNRCYVIHAHSM
jgi:hypothetical protein